MLANKKRLMVNNRKNWLSNLLRYDITDREVYRLWQYAEMCRCSEHPLRKMGFLEGISVKEAKRLLRESIDDRP